MVEPDNEISFFSDFLGDSGSLEAEEFNNIIKEILPEEKIEEEEVKSCMKDLIDNVEKAVQPSKKRPNFRKRPINKPTWIVNKLKAHESGQEHVNNKGKLILEKKIVSKNDCPINCKFNCSQKIDRKT